MRQRYPGFTQVSPQAEAVPARRSDAFAKRGAGDDRLVVAMACTDDDVRAAQRLRYRVFVEEMGARPPASAPGLEADRFDPHCSHILVRQGEAGPVVGTYRLLRGEGARAAGGFICEALFDLGELAALRDDAVEVGRACVDVRLRGGVVLMLLWSAITRYAADHGCRYILGCASLHRRDGGANAARVCAAMARDYMAPVPWRVTPRVPVPRHACDGLEGDVPPVLQGYLRAGAMVCGEPAWDRDFDTADLLVLLPMAGFEPRYARRFLHRPR